MAVIKKLGDRVQREHDQFLRDAQRIEDRSAFAANAGTSPNFGGSVDFESLVSRGDGATVKPDTVIDSTKGWDDDDPWASIFQTSEVRIYFSIRRSSYLKYYQIPTTPTLPPPPTAQQIVYLPSTPSVPPSFAQSSRIITTRVAHHGSESNPIQSSSLSTTVFGSTTSRPATGFNGSPIAPPIQPNYTGSSLQSQASKSLFANSSMMQPLQPNLTGSFLQPQQVPKNQFPAPNYNIALPTVNPAPTSPFPLAPSPPAMLPPPFFNAGTGVMAPSKPKQPTWGNSANRSSKDDWADFDPLA
jgi:SCY1-like protein 2